VTLGDGGNVLKFYDTKDILLTAITNAQNLLANTTEALLPDNTPLKAELTLALR
jgi:hypothetical protein